MSFTITASNDSNGWRQYVITGPGLPADCNGLRAWVDASRLVAEHVGQRKSSSIELAVNIARGASTDEVDLLVARYFNQDACSVPSSWMNR